MIVVEGYRTPKPTPLAPVLYPSLSPQGQILDTPSYTTKYQKNLSLIFDIYHVYFLLSTCFYPPPPSKHSQKFFPVLNSAHA